MTDTSNTGSRDPPYFFFGNAPAGSPMSYQSLQTRRRIAEALASKRSPFPKNAGEGLTYLGEALADRAALADLDRRDREQASLEGNVLRSVPPDENIPGPGASAAPPSGPRIDSGGYNELDAQADRPSASLTGAGATVGDTSTLRGVDPRLVQSVTAGAAYLPEGYTVRPTSGVRPGDRGYHGRGMATDWQIVDPQGKPIPNTGDDTTGLYTTLARGAYTHAQQNYPDMAGQMRWGGAFDKRKGGGTGVPDLMHIDLGSNPQGTNQGNLRPGNQLRRLGPMSGTSDDPRDIIASTMMAPPPTQVASLETGNTATDAGGGGIVPPDAGTPPAAAAEPPPSGVQTPSTAYGAPTAQLPPNPAIATDIPQMPTFTGPGSTAQTPPADFAPAAAAPPGPPPPTPPQTAPPISGPALPPPGGIQRAPDVLPSLQPVPPAQPQVMADPGPAPPHGVIGPSAAMRQWAAIASNSRYSDELRKTAERNYQIGDEFRKEQMSQREANYQEWRKKSDEYEAFQRTAHDRGIEQLTKRLGVEQAQATLEKMYYEQGLPRDQASRKAELEIAQAAQTLAKPDVRELGGVAVERAAGAQVGAPFTKVVAPEGEKLNEQQSNTLMFFQRAALAQQKMEAHGTDVLAGLKDTAAGKVPIAGNYAVTPEYQKARSLADAWILANLRKESGASIRPDETGQYYRVYFPVPGDHPDVVAQKADLRRYTTESLYNSLGDVKAPADRFLAERASRQAPPGTPEGATATNPRTGKKGINRSGYFEDLTPEDLRSGR